MSLGRALDLVALRIEIPPLVAGDLAVVVEHSLIMRVA
jgi:hypothetical protein